MTRAITRITAALLAGYALLAVVLGYWNIVRSDELREREDNPRIVEALRRIVRGEILDRHDEPLAVSIPGAEPGTWERLYPQPETAPVVGYYSLKHGATGIESTYDSVLLGLESRTLAATTWDETLHRPPAGRGVRLTLDVAIQQAAGQALGNRTGAVVVLDAQSGDLLAMVSHPSYDPNRLEARFDDLVVDPAAPLVNRTTQALYQPGPVLEPGLLAAALERGVVQPGEVVAGAGLPVALNGEVQLRCATAETPADLAAGGALAAACPGFFAELGRRLGAAPLDDIFRQLGLYAAPSLPLATVLRPVDAVPSGAQELALAAAGQGDLTVTPLHVALVTAALAREDGMLPVPRLTDAVEGIDGTWATAIVGPSQAVFAPYAATLVRDWMRAAVSDTGPASKAAVAGQDVGGHAGVALSGGGQGTPSGMAWFSGFVYAGPERRPVVVSVLVEDTHSAGTPAIVAGQIFTAIVQRPDR